jgi:hypothetical protein
VSKIYILCDNRWQLIFSLPGKKKEEIENETKNNAKDFCTNERRGRKKNRVFFCLHLFFLQECLKM